MRPQQLEEALMFHAEYRQPCIVIGQPGSAKSAIYRKVFKRIGLPHHTMNLAMSDGTDNRGLPTFIDFDGDQKAVKWVKEQHFLSGSPLAVFIDETFQGMTQVLNSVAPMFWENRLDDVMLPQGSWVCGATNAQGDKAGTNRCPSHIPNRVTILYSELDIDDWSGYMLDGGASADVPMNEYQEPLPLPVDRDIRVIQYCRMKPDSLSDFDGNRLVNATARQWEWVAQYYNVIPEAVRFDVVSGRVGEGHASQLTAFVEMESKLPSRESILLNPSKTAVPEEPSALYLVSGMLAQVATVDNFSSVCTYAKRMPPEFQAMLVRDAYRRTPGLTSTKAFVDWGVKFANVLS